jgi:hypothetical protein
MPRSDWEQREAEQRSAERRMRVILVVAGVLVAAWVGLTLWREFVAPPAQDPATAPATFPAPPAREPLLAEKTYTPPEFRTLVLGKTEAQVTATLGPPRSKSVDATGATVWHYRGVVMEVKVVDGPREPDTFLKIGQDTRLVFTDGKVGDVIFD